MASLRWGASTSPGMVRSDNEDTFVAEPLVFAVADGMGGHQAGEVASALAASIVRDRLGSGAISEDDAESVVHEVNEAIYGAARANAAQSGMGTTLTTLAVLKPRGQGASLLEDQFVLLNVGDSRTYLFRHGRLSRATVDHSYVQELVATGHITMEEARVHPRRNIVTRALGIEPNVRTDMWTMPIVRGDRFVLCSDGLVDEVPDNEIQELVGSIDDPQELAERLVALANEHGGRDNVTVVIVDVLEGAEPPDPTEELSLDSPWVDPGDAAIWHDDTTGQAVDPDADPAATQSDDGATADSPATVVLGTAGSATDGSPLAPPAPAFGAPSGPATMVMPTVPTAGGPDVGGPDDADVKPRRSSTKPPKRRRLTGGVFLFVVLLAAILITTFTLVAVHARSGYYVGFNGDKVVIYKGQPGGVLWFKPTVERDTAYTREELDPAVVALIEDAVKYDTVEEAAEFVTVQVAPPPTTTTEPSTTTTTAASTTTSSTAPGQTTTTFPSGP